MACDFDILKMLMLTSRPGFPRGPLSPWGPTGPCWHKSKQFYGCEFDYENVGELLKRLSSFEAQIEFDGFRFGKFI